MISDCTLCAHLTIHLVRIRPTISVAHVFVDMRRTICRNEFSYFPFLSGDVSADNVTSA